LRRFDRFDALFDGDSIGSLRCSQQVRLIRRESFALVAGTLPRLTDVLQQRRLFGDGESGLILLGR
jgi:hypothetical protein